MTDSGRIVIPALEVALKRAQKSHYVPRNTYSITEPTPVKKGSAMKLANAEGWVVAEKYGTAFDGDYGWVFSTHPREEQEQAVGEFDARNSICFHRLKETGDARLVLVRVEVIEEEANA